MSQNSKPFFTTEQPPEYEYCEYCGSPLNVSHQCMSHCHGYEESFL